MRKQPQFTAASYALAAGLFVVCGLVLSAPWLTGHVTIPWDAKAHFQPQFAFLARALHSGQSPFWTPNVFDGSPQIADPQSLIFAPVFFLVALFDAEPSFFAADTVVFAMLAMGGLAIIVYFRDRNWHPAGAVLAALAFAFGGSAAWRIQHVGQVMSLAWFPLALLALTRALDRKSAGWGLAAGVFSAFLVLGRDQVAYLETLILSAYALIRVSRGWLKPIAAGLVSGLAIVTIPLAFTIALAAQSNRPGIDLSEALIGSMNPASLLTLVSANLYNVSGPLALFWGPPSPSWGETGLYVARNMGELYMGALAVIALAALAVADIPAFVRGRDIRFLTFAAAAMGLYAVGRYTPFFALIYRLPGVDLFRRPADATFPFCALLAILAGYALHCLLADGVRIARTAIAAALLFAACFATALLKDRLPLASGPLAVSAVFLTASTILTAWLSRRRPAAQAILLVAALMTLDLAIGNAPNESTGLPPADFDMLRADTGNTTLSILKEKLAANTSPDRRDRIELAGLGFAWPNASLVHGLDNDLGYNPIRTALFENFTGAGDHVALPEQRVFSKAFPSYRSIAADLTGLRYIATGVPITQIDPRLKDGDLRFVARTSDAYIYENPHALPRVLLATRALKMDFASLVAKGDWPQVDYSTTVLLENPGFVGTLRRAGRAALVSYENTEIVVETDAPDGGWLVLNDVWHPWWRADVDGAPAEILKANGMFRAVALQPGKHAVHFAFAPFSGLKTQIAAAIHDLPNGRPP